MTARVYKAKPDTIDSWTIFFPYPKKMQRQGDRLIKGTFLMCSPGSNDSYFNMCCWDHLDTSLGYSIDALGKRVHGNDIPKSMQRYIKKAEPIWNEAVTKNTPEAWQRWNDL